VLFERKPFWTWKCSNRWCVRISRSLYENEIGDKGITLLAHGMRANSSITHLDVSYNRIANSVGSCVIELSELEQRYLSRRFCWCHQGFAALGELFQFNGYLRELRLDGNLADHEGVSHLTGVSR
jgi:hypothetical protein